MSQSTVNTLRLGARGSLLSRMQSQTVADALEKSHPGLAVELILIKTTGDQIADRPLHDAGGKGLFTKEIEEALIDNRIDLAVHSYKDVPVTMPLLDSAALVIAATPEREDPRDVLVCPRAQGITDLTQGARVGTGSLRRRAQLLAIRPDLSIELIRGNIDTRVKKLRAGDYDAIILALAGLRRSGIFDGQDMTPIDPDQLLPAAGQGALAVQCRRDDPATRAILAPLHDGETVACVNLERGVVQALEGDCHSPIAALATIEDGQLILRTVVAKAGGDLPVIRANATGPAGDPMPVLQSVIADLERQGVRNLLNPEP